MAISRKELIRSEQLCNPPMPKRVLTELRQARLQILFSLFWLPFGVNRCAKVMRGRWKSGVD